MDARALEDLWMLAAASPSVGASRPAPPLSGAADAPRPVSTAGVNATLLIDSDAERDDGDPQRPWFPDFHEAE